MPEVNVPIWLMVVGTVLALLGFALGGNWLIWIGVIVLSAGAVLTLVGGAGRTRA